MPSKPRGACSCSGCPNCAGRCPETTTGGKCSGCTAQSRKAHRGNDHIYKSPRWKALRRQVRNETVWCSHPGCTALWTDLDHEPPLRYLLEHGLDPYARKHVQPLCTPHHSAKTAREVLHQG